jgi:hypothetical protein
MISDAELSDLSFCDKFLAGFAVEMITFVARG